MLEPEGGIMAIGSGGNYALAAARALADTDYDAEEIARRAMKIAAEICIYTNDNLVIESMDRNHKRPQPAGFSHFESISGLADFRPDTPNRNNG